MSEQCRYQNSKLSSSIDQLLANPVLLETLSSVRQSIKDKKEIDIFHNTQDYFNLQTALTEIYDQSIQVAGKKLVGLQQLLGAKDLDKVNLFAELKSVVWSTIISQFNWQNFVGDPVHASNALINYLSKASHVVLNKNRDPIYPRSRLPLTIVRAPEEELIAKEERQELVFIIEEWLSLLTPDVADTVRKHYFNDIAIKELAQETKLTPRAINKRIRNARKKLVKLLVVYDYASHFKEMPFFNDSLITRQDSLTQKRSHLQQVFHNFEKYLSPQVRRALIIYYGLDGRDFCFSFEETAKEMQTSASNVRHLVSLGWNIVSHLKMPSEKTLFDKEKRDLYEAWKKNPNQYSFTSDDERLLFLYFEEHQSTAVISKLLGVSDSTIQRHINNLLNIVASFTSSLND